MIPDHTAAALPPRDHSALTRVELPDFVDAGRRVVYFDPSAHVLYVRVYRDQVPPAEFSRCLAEVGATPAGYLFVGGRFYFDAAWIGATFPDQREQLAAFAELLRPILDLITLTL